MTRRSAARAANPDTGQNPGGVPLAGLGNRFVELFGRRLSRPAFAQEMAALLGDTVRVKAVAVMGYDRRRERLGLLAELGLRDDARAALGAGGDCMWDIPLRGLHNRRISVIEAAHQNPFVPRPLIAVSPAGLSIASLPVYYDYDPAGVVLLFAAGSRSFPDSVLQTLSQALRVCGRGLRDTEGPAARLAITEHFDEEADPRRAPAAGQRNADGDAAAPPAEGPRTPEPQLRLVERARASGRSADAQGLAGEAFVRTQQIEQELVRAREELERAEQTVRTLTASGHAVAGERDDLAQQLTEAQRLYAVETTELRAQVGALEERLLALDSDRTRAQRASQARLAAAQQSVATLERERAALASDLQAAREELARRATLAEELSHTATQLEAARTNAVADAAALTRTRDDERAARAEAEQTLRANLAAIHTRAEQLAGTVAMLRSELAERTRAGVDRDQRLAAQNAEIKALRAGLADLQTTLQEVGARRAAAEEDAQTVQAERDRLSALLTEVGQRAALLDTARSTAVAECATLRQALEQERGSQQSTAQGLQADLATAQSAVTQLSAEAAAERDAQRATLHAVHEQVAQLEQDRSSLQAKLVQLQQQTEQTAAAHREAQAVAEHATAALQEALDRLRAERERLAAEHAEQRGHIEAQRTTVAELQAALEEIRTERERTEAEGHTAASRLAETHRRMEELSALLRQRDTAVDIATTERQRLAAQIGTLTSQLRASQESLDSALGRYALERTALEVERDAWMEKTTAALAERDHFARVAEDLQQATAQLHAARNALAAERAAQQRTLEDERANRIQTEQSLRDDLSAAQVEAERAAHEAQALHGALKERGEQLAALRQEQEAAGEAEAGWRQDSAALRAELATLTPRLEERAAEIQRLQERREAAEREQALLQEQLRGLTEERRHLEADKVAQHAELEAQRAALEELQDRLHQHEAAVEAASSERQQLEEALTAAEAATAELRSKRDELRRTVQEATAPRAQAPVLAPAQAPAQALAQAPEPPPVRGRHPARSMGPLVIERSAPLGTIVEDEAEPLDAILTEAVGATAEAAPAPSGELVLLDDGVMRDMACAALKGAGIAVTAFTPSELSVDAIARRKVKCVMLNLAGGPAAWRMLRVLRERAGTQDVPVLAYLMTPDAQSGFCFGRTDFALWPMDTSRMLERLRRLRPRLRRLLVLTADVDGMGRMRESLAQERISTSIVLDGKQALEFVAMVQPEAAVLHLSPACPTASRAILGFRASDSTRDLPLLILVDNAQAAREDAFFNSTALQLLNKTPFQFTNLPEEIARLIG